MLWECYRGSKLAFPHTVATNVTNTIQLQLKVNSPITGLERPRGFQEVKVPRLHDNGTGWW
jgi:hypothetical protein